MKRFLQYLGLVILMPALLISFVACGKSEETESVSTDSSDSAEVEEPLDLTGSWAQKGKEGEDAFQAGFIKDGMIELFWVSDGGDTHMLYWSGTYEAPTTTDDEYTWDSVNDKTKTDTALLASGDDTKTFSYKNGEISYEASALGETATITLVKSDNDYTSFAVAGETSAAAQDGQQIDLVKSGYKIRSSDSYNYVYYAVQIHNPNAEYAVEFPKITVTAKSADGKILTTEDQVINAIAADDVITYGSYVSYEGDVPDSVDISVNNGDDDYMHQEGSGVIRQDELSISNTSENEGSYDKKYTGEITNNSTEDLDMAAVIVIFKDGEEIVGGETAYIDDLKSGTTLPFEVSVSNDIDYDSYEIYGMQW